jgi:hypothetical protein
MMTHIPLNTHTITTANLVSSSLGAGSYGMDFVVSSSMSFTVVCVLLVVAVLFIVKYVNLYVLRVLRPVVDGGLVVDVKVGNVRPGQ